MGASCRITTLPSCAGSAVGPVTHALRAVFRNVDSMVAARELYGRITAPVTLAYGGHDWSRVPEREANLALLPSAQSIILGDTGTLLLWNNRPASLRSSSPTSAPDPRY